MSEMTDSNKVHYDLVDVHVAALTITDGVASFGTPEPLQGSISMDLAAQGDTIKLRADGMDYYVTYSNDGYSGNLNLAMVPDWFKAAYLGHSVSEKDKVLVENSNAEHKPFALLYGFKGDKKNRRHVLYNCMGGRASVKGDNKDRMKEADTESLPITATPLPDGMVKASTTESTPDTVYANWTKTVWVKDTASA